MKKGMITTTALALTLGLLSAGNAQARDTKLMLSVEEAMSSADFQEKLDPSITFSFGGLPNGKRIGERHGNYISNKKTNAFGKSDEEACRWALLSALLSFQDRARSEGGDAVVNLESYYNANPMISTTQFECHAGAIMAGVALRGDVVTLAP
tara:strand:- start:3433 stop:3888 length:456 start_codon:yes stop_codon:yes gene_type:complete